MNRTGYDKGNAYVADSLEALTASSMKLDSMAHKTLGSTSLDTNWKEYQYHANNACTLEHSGEQLIVSNTIYTGTYKSRHGKDRESGQDIQLQRFANGRVQTLARAHEDLTVKDNPLIMEHIQQEGSLGLLAMVGGDFDGDGNQELAIYTPWSYNPFIIVYRFDSSKGELVEEQRLYLGDINTSFSTSSSDWRMPIVHLATFSHGSYDDLVVTLSLPLTYQNGYGSHSPFSYMAIYSRKTKETRPRLERIYHYIPDFGSYRMRFASTLQTDLNGNGVPELIMAGHYNAYSKGDQVGWMVPEKNLVQMFTFDTVKEIYQYVWDVPQEVPRAQRYLRAVRDVRARSARNGKVPALRGERSALLGGVRVLALVHQQEGRFGGGALQGRQLHLAVPYEPDGQPQPLHHQSGIRQLRQNEHRHRAAHRAERGGGIEQLQGHLRRALGVWSAAASSQPRTPIPASSTTRAPTTTARF